MRNKYLDDTLQDISSLEKLRSMSGNMESFSRFMLTLEQPNYISLDDYRGLPDEVYYSMIKKESLIKPCFKPSELGDFVSRLNVEEQNFVWKDKYEKGYGTLDNGSIVPDRIHGEFNAQIPWDKFCIGVGTYKTQTQGNLYMCVLIDLFDKSIAAVSFGSVKSYVLAEKVIGKIAHARNTETDVFIVHSSQNELFQSGEYHSLANEHHFNLSMTQPGTRSGVAPVSTFFSQLKRKMGMKVFEDKQDAVDWLENYVFCYNLKRIL